MSTLVGSGYPTGYPNYYIVRLRLKLTRAAMNGLSGDEKVEK
jgi:hypothetical protein